MTFVRLPWGRNYGVPWLMQVTAAVMVVDALLLTAHVAHLSVFVLDLRGGWFPVLRWGTVWNGGLDGSLMELFGLLQLGVAALLFLRRGLLEPSHRVLAAWGAVFLLLILDDLFRIHERVGARLNLGRVVPSLDEAAAQELGGLVFWAVSGLVLAGGLIGLHRGSAPAARSASRAVLATVAPFAVVAVGYVLLSAVHPGLVHSPEGQLVALTRMTVKLLTMTLVLVQALRLSTSRP